MDNTFLAQFYGKSQNYTDIPNHLYKDYNVKKGLRNEDGTGVLVGLTRVADVVGYTYNEDGTKVDTEGTLFFRGIDINEIVKIVMIYAIFMKKLAFYYYLVTYQNKKN